MKKQFLFLLLLVSNVALSQGISARGSEGGGGGVTEDGSDAISLSRQMSNEAKQIFSALNVPEYENPNDASGYRKFVKQAGNLSCIYINSIYGPLEEYSCELQLHRTAKSSKEIYVALNLPEITKPFNELPEYIESTKEVGPLKCVKYEHSTFGTNGEKDKYECSLTF